VSFSSTGDEFSSSIFKSIDNRIILTGNSYAPSYPNKFLIKTDSSLNLIRDSLFYYNAINTSNAVIENPNHEILVTGQLWDTIQHTRTLMIAKFDSSLTRIWEKSYSLDSLEGGASIIQSTSGGYYVIGGGNGNIELMKIDEDGNLTYSKLLDDSGHSSVIELIQISPNKLAILGSSTYNTHGACDIHLIICDTLGNFNTEIKEYNILNANHYFVVYPNPITNFIYIKSISPERIINRITIFNLSGKIIYQKDNINSLLEMINTELTLGVYTIQIADIKDKKEYYKIIIQN
ncbi:MAG: T9SS type A sorting domain-containing protein, partial [Bacteroidia bacterium]|nr:T9SS type A sorting domain-containing protein [Bacteroidia bacterium]